MRIAPQPGPCRATSKVEPVTHLLDQCVVEVEHLDPPVRLPAHGFVEAAASLVFGQYPEDRRRESSLGKIVD
jgi:hypothetical protein